MPLCYYLIEAEPLPGSKDSPQVFQLPVIKRPLKNLCDPIKAVEDIHGFMKDFEGPAFVQALVTLTSRHIFEILNSKQ